MISMSNKKFLCKIAVQQFCLCKPLKYGQCRKTGAMFYINSFPTSSLIANKVAAGENGFLSYISHFTSV